jgi:hypothetical protein
LKLNSFRIHRPCNLTNASRRSHASNPSRFRSRIDCLISKRSSQCTDRPRRIPSSDVSSNKSVVGFHFNIPTSLTSHMDLKSICVLVREKLESPRACSRQTLPVRFPIVHTPVKPLPAAVRRKCLSSRGGWFWCISARTRECSFVPRAAFPGGGVRFDQRSCEPRVQPQPAREGGAA